MDNPGFQPDAEAAAAALAHALAASGGSGCSGGGRVAVGGGSEGDASLPNNRRAPAADRRSLKNSRRQQQLARPHQQLQRVFSVSCRALDVPPLPASPVATAVGPAASPLALAAAAGATVHNNNAGELKAAAAAAAAAAMPHTAPSGWSRGGGRGRGLLGLGCRRRWELRPSPPPLLLALLVAAAATLALVTVAAVLAATSVLEGSTTPLPASDAVPATTLVRGEFRLQPPSPSARQREREREKERERERARTPAPEGSPSHGDQGSEGAELILEADAASAAGVAALLSHVFRNFPRFAAAAASVEPAVPAPVAERARATEGVVRCELTFRAPAGSALAPRVGLHFLGALRPRAGRLWLLGRLPVDPRSVFFEEVTPPFAEEAPEATASEPPMESPSPPATTGGLEDPPAPETATRSSGLATRAVAPAAWGPWSPWSECGLSGTQRRTRSCLAGGGSGPPIPTGGPCLLLPGGGGDLEVRDCRHQGAGEGTAAGSVTIDALLGGVTRMQMLREAPAPPPTTDDAPTESSITEATPSEDTHPPAAPPALALTMGPRRCDVCLLGEVCVALAGETLPACRTPLDVSDPTGCGGFCRLGKDVCRRLDHDAFRCVEDSPCLSEEWRCGNLLCIPHVKRCDGHLNCYDHTDEFDCECDLRTHFHCGNKTSCLPRSKQCDHIIDCWDGSDELNCTQACPQADEFTCSDGQCIPQVQFCDGLADCHDQSDEPFGCGGACKRHEWRCKNGRCVKKAAVCDGAGDCGDGSDEAVCPVGRSKNQPN